MDRWMIANMEVHMTDMGNITLHNSHLEMPRISILHTYVLSQMMMIVPEEIYQQTMMTGTEKSSRFNESN